MTPQRTQRLRAQLQAHHAADATEARSVQRTLALLNWLHDPFEERSDPTHVTGSAIAVDPDRRVLLHRHKRLGIWLQPGGHVDAGETCEEAALRETVEETGITGTLARPSPLHVNVHQGPRGHVHLDIRWLVRVPAGVEPAPPAGESQDVEWFTPEEALQRTDAKAAAAIRAALGQT